MQNQQKNLEEQELNKDIEEQERRSKQLEDIQNPDVKPKKTIVVIGRMGHGKSSFIKMLVSQEDKAKIIAAPDIKSVTKQCSLYEICPQIKEKLQIAQEQKIYLMDTPGLNSNAKNYLIMDQIRKKLILQKCQVISILYIKNSTQFRQQQENNSIGMYFALPISKKIKDKITTFILTNYDKQINNPKQFENFMKKLKQSYKQNNLDFLLSKTIKWMSYTQQQQDNQILKENLQTPRYKKAFQKQYEDLKQTLQSKQGEKFGYKQLTQLTDKFNQLWKQKFQKVLQKQNQTQKDQVNFNFQTGDQQSLEIFFKALHLTGLTGYATFGVLSVAAQAATTTTGIIVGSAALLASAVFLATLGVGAGLFYLYYKKKRTQAVVNQLQKLKDQKQLEIKKQQLQLENLSLQYVSNYCLKKLNMKAVKGGYLQFDFQTWIEQIIVQSKQVKLQQNRIKKGMKWIYKKSKDDTQTGFKQTKYEKKTEKNKDVTRNFGSLLLKPNHQYKFIIKIRRPTQKVIVDLIKQTTHEIYGK